MDTGTLLSMFLLYLKYLPDDVPAEHYNSWVLWTVIFYFSIANKWWVDSAQH